MWLLIIEVVILVAAYLLGSIPTALLFSRYVKHIDIRAAGNGNMGAQNTFHILGAKFGVLVAALDISKGAFTVLLAHVAGLSVGWQIAAGILTILGHDFPVFANFRGGQGTATTLGTMLALFPIPTLIGAYVYGIMFLLIKNSSRSLSVGGALIALILGITQQWLLLVYAVAVFLFIPVKMWIDSPRRKAIQTAKQK
jgi:glycerol-3-phosphate acyltransferase PlsY